MERTDLGVLDLVVPSSHAGKVSLLLTLSVCYVAYRVRVAPPSPPPAAPKQPWERSMGSATVLAVQGNIFGTISYVYGDAARGECVVVDSSGHAAYLSREAAKRGLRVTQLLQTHGHLDHVQALSDYLRAWRSLPPPKMHPGDRAMLGTYGIPIPSYGPLRVPCVARAAAAVVAWALGMSREPMPETANLDDGDVLAVGALRLEVLHVPGHTPGSCCFYDRVNKVLFSGDFLGRPWRRARPPPWSPSPRRRGPTSPRRPWPARRSGDELLPQNFSIARWAL